MMFLPDSSDNICVSVILEYSNNHTFAFSNFSITRYFICFVSQHRSFRIRKRPMWMQASQPSSKISTPALVKLKSATHFEWCTDPKWMSKAADII